MSKKPADFSACLKANGVSRRSFLKFCTALASLLALPSSAVPALSEKLRLAVRPSVIWLSFQECTGCTESLTRSHDLTIEELMLDYLSLDYHHTFQAASGAAAEAARAQAMRRFSGRYLLLVDGAVPTANGGVYSTIAGKSNLEMLKECSAGAAAIIAVGSCAAFGGLPAASPNPTGATGVSMLMRSGQIPQKPLVNLPGCPPLPAAISGVLAHFLAFGRFPVLDDLNRPLSIYRNTVHERCSRYHFFQQEKFAQHFDDEAARKGWCLYKLGCRGPVTHNACAVYKWNQGTSFPIESGHPCIGCAEPGFWDQGGFYRSLDAAALAYQSGDESAESAIEEGHQLYHDSCVYCHSVDPSGFRTDPAKIAELLRSGEIRSHRRLRFSEDQISILDKYLRSGK
ncbi:MAG: hydrogenase small subunit [Gammaproteobacteria bacterium]|nr:hydrogenase small subunit [Gammaproteobacteria bacterium]HXK56822.1 hydrogenase small subunit [Gammaproteobacteria bacterium]